MTEQGGAPDPLAAVLDVLNATKDELTATKDEVVRLRVYGRRNRKFIWFDIALTILLTAVSIVAVFAIQSAHDAEQNNRALCLSSNVARSQQVGLWDYLFSLAGPPKTAQGAKLTEEFKHHLQVVFAPRNCNHPDAKTP